jgi:hypothetical protein
MTNSFPPFFSSAKWVQNADAGSIHILRVSRYQRQVMDNGGGGYNGVRYWNTGALAYFR